MNLDFIKDPILFKLEDLHGKTLKIRVGQDVEDGYETTVVAGNDTSTGIMYVLNSTQRRKVQPEQDI